MAGDLEDFLKRAAERRAAKQRQQQGGGGAPPPQRQQRPPAQQPIQRPTPARPQPQQRQRFEEPIPVAEVVEPVNPLAEQQRRLEEAKKKAEDARQKLAKQMRRKQGSTSEKAAPGVVLSGSPAEQLLAMLRQPNGMQQAFLLREILDRPDFD
ncbi:MAG: hypothetical protein AAFU85_18420 [Planctomycetota bacterium]